MTVLIIICGLILVSAFVFLFRASPPPPSQGPTISEADALLLKDTVIQKLQERLAGWTVESTGTLEIVAIEAASERRMVLNLAQLAELWLPFHAQKADEDANGVIEDFVEGATGEREADESDDGTWVQAALALQLFKPGEAPKVAITRPAGPLIMALVVRNPAGPEALVREELQSWGIDEDAAFRIAFENMASEAEDSLPFEPLGEEDPPTSFSIASGDPLAASYALIPAVAPMIRKHLGEATPYLFLGKHALIATTNAEPPETDEAFLLDGPQPLDVIATPLARA